MALTMSAIQIVFMHNYPPRGGICYKSPLRLMFYHYNLGLGKDFIIKCHFYYKKTLTFYFFSRLPRGKMSKLHGR